MTVHLFESKITKKSNTNIGLQLCYHESKYRKAKMIKIKNQGLFDELKPGYTLLGINQKSVRGMSLSQVYKILQNIKDGEDVIILAKYDDGDGTGTATSANGDECADTTEVSGNANSFATAEKSPRVIGVGDTSSSKKFSTRTLSERKKKSITETKCAHCCVPVGDTCACEGCHCRIQ